MNRKLLVSVGLVVCLVMAFALPACVPKAAPPVEEEKPPVEEEAPPVEVVDEVEEWLKANKVGPYQEEEVDYDALYQAAKEEGKVVVYTSTSRIPKSLELGFNDKYPGIEVEITLTGSTEIMHRVITEQLTGIYEVDVIMASEPPTQVNVLHGSNMVFPWVPPDLRDVIPKEFQDPLLVHRLTGVATFYNMRTWPEEPPIDSWWDMTRPEWKGRLVVVDPRTYSAGLNLFTTIVLNAEEMARDYEREFGKPIELTTPNAGYEWIKMIIANEPKLVGEAKEARYIGEPQPEPALGVNWDICRITDTGDPKYGDIKYGPVIGEKPRQGLLYPSYLNIAYKAPHPNAAKLLIRWLVGEEEGGGGFEPWFVPGYWPARADVSKGPPHPFIPELSWTLDELDFWRMDMEGVWKLQEEVLNFIVERL